MAQPNLTWPLLDNPVFPGIQVQQPFACATSATLDG